MNGRVLPFEGPVHREVERLLPWFVNDSLDAEERVLVEGHLEQCPACRHEVVELHDLQASLADDPEFTSDTSRGWQRLHRRLQAERRERAALPWWRAFGDGWLQSPSWLRWGVAAQSLALLLGGAQLFVLRTAPVAYRTFGAEQSSAATSGNLVILFDPQVTEAQLRGLLRASDARIVDGPNAAGAYVLTVPVERLATARAALRAASGVALVESLAAEDAQ